jgi:hypothetical protein
MYNIHSHYETIFQYLKNIVEHRRLLYLLPYGSTDPINIETITDHLAEVNKRLKKAHPLAIGVPRFVPRKDGPLFIFYDQEPIYGKYNYQLFDHINNNYIAPHVLVTTEKNSEPLNDILKKYNWKSVYYFHHAFAAADWYRGYQFNEGLIHPTKRKINKKYITFNRITGNSRVYRSFLIAELSKNDLLKYGHVSYSDVCPVHGHYHSNIPDSTTKHGVPIDYANQSKNYLDQIQYPLRIDEKHSVNIPNGSQTIGPIEELMESFLHIVTETCFWETKDHLTEKIFKPIVARQPFVLLGCANNLKYLKSYGFKTFDSWWDESYDQIENPIERLQAVVKIINEICSMTTDELESMLRGMQYVLDYNYNWFYSKEFLDVVWNELTFNLQDVVLQLSHQNS